jgi:hypothetical protein
MGRPARRHPAGEGDVDPLGLEQGLVALGLQLGPAGGQLGLEGGPGLVDPAAEVAAGVLVQAAEGALDLAEGRAPGQVGLLGLAEGLQVGGVGSLREHAQNTSRPLRGRPARAGCRAR